MVLPATTSAKEGLAGGAACVDPEAPGEAAAVAAGRCWLALRFLPADFGALLAAGTCGAETVALAEGEGSALAASNCFRTRATWPAADLGALLARPRCPRRSLRRCVIIPLLFRSNAKFFKCREIGTNPWWGIRVNSRHAQFKQASKSAENLTRLKAYFSALTSLSVDICQSNGTSRTPGRPSVSAYTVSVKASCTCNQVRLKA